MCTARQIQLHFQIIYEILGDSVKQLGELADCIFVVREIEINSTHRQYLFPCSRQTQGEQGAITDNTGSKASRIGCQPVRGYTQMGNDGQSTKSSFNVSRTAVEARHNSKINYMN